jgi:hypothetical protein
MRGAAFEDVHAYALHEGDTIRAILFEGPPGHWFVVPCGCADDGVIDLQVVRVAGATVQGKTYSPVILRTTKRSSKGVRPGTYLVTMSLIAMYQRHRIEPAFNADEIIC